MSLPQAKHEEASDMGLPFLAGVEVAKILGGVLGSTFTGLDDEQTDLFSRVLRCTSG